MNYESELYDLLLFNLSHLYGIESESLLYQYFYHRYKVNLFENRIRREDEYLYTDLASFLLSELNIPIKDRGFMYKEEHIDIFTITNIMRNWHFRASLCPVVDEYGNKYSLDDFIEISWNEMLKKNKLKLKLFISNEYYTEILKYHILIEINDKYDTEVLPPKLIKDIAYPQDFNIFKRTLEEELGSYMDYINNDESVSYSITENDVEDYVIKNLHLLEDGMKYLDRQVIISEGRIDILAKDKNNVYTIIEVKINEDKNIIWQCIYYPEEIRKIYKQTKVRMITLCPDYSYHMASTLDKIPGIERYEYNMKVKSGKIKNMEIRNSKQFIN